MRQCLSFFRKEPVHEEFGCARMWRIRKYRYAAAGTAGPYQAYLLGQKDLLDREPFFRQRREFLAAGGDRMEGKSATDEPGFQNSTVIRKRHTGVEKVATYPLLTSVGFEITVDHLPYSRWVAHSLAENLTLPARVEKIGLFLYRRDLGFFELVSVVPSLVLILFGHVVDKRVRGCFVSVPMATEIPIGRVHHLGMDEQGRKWYQRFRRHQSLIVLAATDQCDVHDVSSRLSLRQHSVDRVGGVAGRDFDFDAKFFAECVDNGAVLARRRTAGSNHKSAFLLRRRYELGPFLLEIRGGGCGAVSARCADQDQQ